MGIYKNRADQVSALFEPRSAEGQQRAVSAVQSFSAPHPKGGAEKSLQADQLAVDQNYDSNLSPHPDNMGGDSVTSGVDDIIPIGSAGYFLRNVKKQGVPEEYFYKLSIDTLQVGIHGEWKDEASRDRLLRLRAAAEQDQKRENAEKLIPSVDGRYLRIFPHGGRGGYQVLIRDKEGLEIRALPSMASLPPFMVRFGARWCFNHEPKEMCTWIGRLLIDMGFYPDEYAVSRLDLKCDVPTPFDQGDVDRLRGVSMRNGKFAVHRTIDDLQTITNIGGEKEITYSIYDKREEQKHEVFWPTVWKTFGIPDHIPIWRVEARWKRNRLREFGIERVRDLNSENLCRLWGDFAGNYLQIRSDKAGRKDRSVIAGKWMRISRCGLPPRRIKVEATVDVSEARLVLQAAGAIRAALNKATGLKVNQSVRAIVDDVISKAFEGAGKLSDVSEAELLECVVAAVREHPDINAIPEEAWTMPLLKAMAERMRDKMGSSTSTTNGGGGDE